MKEFIYEVNNSLSNEVCDNIIEYFEENRSMQYDGYCSSIDKGVKVNKDLKETLK